MTTTDQLVEHARKHSEKLATDLPAPPVRGVAVVACMDARLDVYGTLGLTPGDAHVIRNAGGVVTADVLRSLTISQRLLGTREIVLLHHTDCGMQTFTDDELRSRLEAETGIRPSWSPESFPDVVEDVRQSRARILADPLILHKDAVRGFVFSVSDGSLTEVD
ncbi:carbonic anhydrase [Georgenia sp. 10Sc9-8]|uniref:carbonic anhydrase n=1 Tax=Georgenia halotolerans TaxID=3028317 RepID=A0ABT5TVF5_9MICO|nr:carbonic anhydrase [Georgenia halotolerans]